MSIHLVSFNDLLGIGNQPTFTRLPPIALHGPPLRRMLQETPFTSIRRVPHVNKHGHPVRVPTRKALPEGSLLLNARLCDMEGINPDAPYSTRGVTLSRSSSFSELPGGSSDFQDFLPPHQLTTWDFDDAVREEESSAGPPILQGIRDLTKRLVQKLLDVTRRYTPA
ncbi:hypothetical protein K504DRAFT_456491 [Pleomassaria siparia CBS 279.74]|uniref:Uncharacterized protein n=1 Tax=Pleomassaria siparia CBS 279.74 TaxID=1314801 RepID=A0A6G1K6I2_9PLEO|nr:hypothetical protein K504DRAFT_456491 [Pleomassaria siparia CBS 279.74]